MPQTTIYVAPRLAGTLGTVPPAVATVDLARLFGRSAALAGISLTVEMGRTVALLGPNGAGKTTLLRILATSIRPSYGTLLIDGIDALRSYLDRFWNRALAAFKDAAERRAKEV